VECINIIVNFAGCARRTAIRQYQRAMDELLISVFTLQRLLDQQPPL